MKQRKLTGKSALFLKLANPDENGYSREIFEQEFVGEYASLASSFGNGNCLTRKGSVLSKRFFVVTRKEKKKVVSIQLSGFRNSNASNYIRPDIKKHFSKQNCVSCGTSVDLQCDHKDGRKDDARVMEGNGKNQLIEDFQSLCGHCNTRKRQVCKECNDTGLRYNAKELYFSLPVIKGSLQYDTLNKCQGCYWHDPRNFKQEISMNTLVSYEEKEICK
jgi:hypothetical protein